MTDAKDRPTSDGQTKKKKKRQDGAPTQSRTQTTYSEEQPGDLNLSRFYQKS